MLFFSRSFRSSPSTCVEIPLSANQTLGRLVENARKRIRNHVILPARRGQPTQQEKKGKYLLIDLAYPFKTAMGLAGWLVCLECTRARIFHNQRYICDFVYTIPLTLWLLDQLFNALLLLRRPQLTEPFPASSHAAHSSSAAKRMGS